MVEPSRRDLVGGMLVAAGAVATGAYPRKSADFSDGPGNMADPSIIAARRLIADLGAAIRTPGLATAELRDMFNKGGEVNGPVGVGDFVLTANPLRAIAMMPIRLRGVDLKLPVIVAFSGVGSTVRIRSLGVGPADIFDALRSPTGPATLGKEFGEDDDDDLQTHYDRLAQSGGGILSIPPGRFETNLILHARNVHLSGAGRRATTLAPRDTAQPVLRALYREGSWTYVTIANLDIEGIDGRGTGFAAGSDAYHSGDEFAGRTRFVNVGFADLSIAIRRDAGQIGLTIEHCGFGPADHHLYSVANRPGNGEIMHAGVLTARDCHFTGARIAVAHIDSPTEGTGAVLFDNCIMESNPGFVFYVPAFGNVDATTDFVVRDCWNERNGTSAQISIKNRRVPVRYGLFANVGMVRFDGTPLGPLNLRNAVVATYRCPLDNLSLIERDAQSSIRHSEARGFGSYAPLGLATTIAAAAQSEPPGRALSFVVPKRKHLGRPSGGKVLLSLLMQSPLVLVGSESIWTRSVRDPILPNTQNAQQVSIRRGMTIFPPPVVVPSKTWLVWLFNYRLVAGSGPFFQISGDRGISAKRRLDDSEWTTLAGMAEVAPGAREISLWMMQEDDASELMLGGCNLVIFSTRQAALDFVNSEIFAIE